MTAHPPAGWRPMWELPAPGRKRVFLFIDPTNGEQVQSPEPVGHLKGAIRLRGDGTIDQSECEPVHPIGWRYDPQEGMRK